MWTDCSLKLKKPQLQQLLWPRCYWWAVWQTGPLWCFDAGPSDLQQSTGHWLDSRQISSISHCRTSPLKARLVIDFLIMRTNWWIRWLFFSSEHLSQCAGGVSGVRWHPVPRWGWGVFRTLLHREWPGGTAGAGSWAVQQCETMKPSDIFRFLLAQKHFAVS